MPAPRTGQATAKLFSSVSDRCCRTPRMSRDCLLLVLDLRWVPVQRACWYCGAGAASLLPMIHISRLSSKSHTQWVIGRPVCSRSAVCVFAGSTFRCISEWQHWGCVRPPRTTSIGGFALASESNMQILNNYIYSTFPRPHTRSAWVSAGSSEGPEAPRLTTANSQKPRHGAKPSAGRS